MRDEDIKYIHELEERVHELEEEHKKYVSFTESNNYNMDVEFEKLYKQNKRYREALEFYANKINYLTFIENGKSNIEHDQGGKARKALEGEE